MCKYVAVMHSKYSLYSGLLKSTGSILIFIFIFHFIFILILNLIHFLIVFSGLIGLCNPAYPISPFQVYKEVSSMHASRF